MASTRLSNTMGTPTLGTKFTYSVWVKRSGLGSAQTIASIWLDGSNHIVLRFDAQDNLSFYANVGGSYPLELETHDVFKDVSAWYHIVAKVDTTQATSSNRCKLYVNGVESTNLSTSTYPSQDATFSPNASGTTHYVGGRGDGSYWDGLITHAHFIDGSAYDASTFGETDSTSGIWKSKTGSITYGTNGFFLKFENSGNLDLDSSGNSRSFSTSGTLTQNIDTPTNNFSTLNPLDNPYPAQIASFSNGNLTGAGTETGFLAGSSSIGVSSGKWYAEFKLTAGTSSFQAMGVVTSPVGAMGTQAPHDNTKFYGVRGNGSKYQPGGSGTSSWATTWTTNDIISLAMDLDNNRLYVAKNGQYADGSGNYDEAFTGSPAYITLASDETYHFMGGSISTGSGVSLTMQSNFGSGYFGTTVVASAGTAPSEGGIFEYDCPSGYQALCTKGINSF